MLGRRSQSLADIVKVLQAFHDNVDEQGEQKPVDGMDVDGETGEPTQKMILEGLLGFLESCV